VNFGEGFAELFLGDEALLDEDFSQKAVASGGLLVFQSGVEGGLGDQALVEQDLADGLSFGGGGDHGTLNSELGIVNSEIEHSARMFLSCVVVPR
jgi:hypothetical protein